MAATVVACPMCARKLRLPADLVGRTVKCANCGGTFEAKEEPSAPPSSRRETPPSTARRNTPPPSSRPRGVARSDSSRSRSRGEKDDDQERCPFCRERNRSGASRCRHCGKDLEAEEDDRPWERSGVVRRDCEPHRGGIVLTLGITSIVLGVAGIPFFLCWGLGAIPAVLGLGLGIPAWIMGHRDLAMMREGVKDPAGRGSTQGGWICGIIGTCVSAVLLLISAAMLLLMIIVVATSPGPGAAPGPGPGQQPRPGRRMELDFHAPRGFAWLGRDATIVDWCELGVIPERPSISQRRHHAPRDGFHHAERDAYAALSAKIFPDSSAAQPRV
jgi:hypothetical protein